MSDEKEIKDNTGNFKKRDEEVKPEVKNEKLQIEEITLKDIIADIDWSKEGDKPTTVLPTTKVIIVAFDPATRGVIVKHVKNSAGLTSALSILRECTDQLQNQESIDIILANVQNIVKNECAKLYASLANKR